MSLVRNGKVIATNSPQISLTRAEYDALPAEVKEDPKNTFYIIDDAETDYEKLVNISTLIGSPAPLAGYADGTIIGAIKELNDRLGGLSFKIDPEYNHVQAEYSDEVPNNVIQQLASNATDSEKMAYIETLLGDPTVLDTTTYDTLVGAIVDLYRRLNDLEFAYNSGTNTVEVTDLK